MKIVILGLSITSSWGNCHATTFRALARALHGRGHRVLFVEKDVEWYRSNRDMPEPPFCDLLLYQEWSAVRARVAREMDAAELVMVGSYFPDGAEAIDQMLDSRAAVRSFYDIDTPITLAELRRRGHADYVRTDQLRGLDLYLSFTGGPVLTELERTFGVRRAVPLYCSVDPERYHRRTEQARFRCAMSYMGTYAPDRQPKLEEMLCGAARVLPEERFIVAGPQYPETARWPQNVSRIVHLNPRWHPHLYSSSRVTLNLTRREMVIAGYSPSVRLFEAAACGACIASDNWPGLESFFQGGREILIPSSADELVRCLRDYPEDELHAIGAAAAERVLTHHTSDCRAQELEREVERVLTPSARLWPAQIAR